MEIFDRCPCRARSIPIPAIKPIPANGLHE
jgi:hypothetical protein